MKTIVSFIVSAVKRYLPRLFSFIPFDMMKVQLPFYVHFSLMIIGTWFLLYGFYLGKDILVPLGFSFLIAVMLHPLETFFEKHRAPKVIAILLSLFIAVAVLFALFSLLSHQVRLFVNDLPAIKQNLSTFLNNAQQWISDKFHFSEEQQKQVIQKAKSNGIDNVKAVAGTTLDILTASLVTLTLVPIYVFLFLYYRVHLLTFIIQVFHPDHSQQVRKAVGKIRWVVQKYVTGLLIETICVAVLNSIGLLLIGARFAILLGIIGAILNLIPYIGGLIAIVLTAIVTLSNTGSVPVTLGSAAVYLVVQFIDNNFLVPKIIGSSVQLNALVSIIAVLVGGALCGVGGMFLSLPFVAICKIVFDHVEDMKVWGNLLGDEESARWNVIKHYRMKKGVKRNSQAID